MNPAPPTASPRSRTAALCGAAAALLGLAVLAGWARDIVLLKSIVAGLFAVKANAAVCLVLAGGALALLPGARRGSPRQWIGRAAAGLAGALALATLSQDVFGWDLGIDQRIFPEPAGAVFTTHLGRMPPTVSLSFIGLSLAVLRLDSRRAAAAIQSLALFVGLVAAASVTGYLFGARAFPNFGCFKPMSILMALGLVALAVGVLAATAGRGFVARMRRQLPVIGFGFAVALLAAAGAASFLNARRLVAADDWITHTHQVMLRLETVESASMSLIAAARGYVVTGQEQFLALARDSRRELGGSLASARGLIADNPAQQARLNELESLVQSRLARTDEAVRIRREQGAAAAAAFLSTGEGVRLAAGIRDQIAAMHRAEEDLLARRRADAEASNASTFLALGFAGAASLALLSAMFAAARRLNRGLEAANRDLSGQIAAREQLQSDLERHFRVAQDLICVIGFDGYFKELNPAWEKTLGWTRAELTAKPFLEFVHPDDRQATGREAEKLEAGGVVIAFENRYRCRDGTHRWMQWNSTADTERQLMYATARDITDRKRAEEEMQRLNNELRHRAAQLAEANKELESFSYSVSHDLRAPLRHVQGYVQMLAREAGGGLSEKSRRFLQTITDASAEMGHLIDDLLSFSRMGRAAMQETRVKLDDLARAALRDLDSSLQGRNIVWNIRPLPVVRGDPALLKLVFANLLGNAVKYTRPRDPAVIELGVMENAEGRMRHEACPEGHSTFFVRDNGVGFDPRYAHKLFGVFQRLHGGGEFEGTGIGLANVRRIITRHGGQTWAEGKVGEGATFYFTLRGSEVHGSTVQGSEVENDPACTPSNREPPNREPKTVNREPMHS